MNEPSQAVFLSYASQDVEAARRICAALRAAGIEVFLDQSELRGGDAWDHKIRQKIHDCALFIPIVSQHTQERLEGYFRHEWKLAIERSHHMAEQKPFLVPVVVDGTRDQEAVVPDAFRAVQWTRLPAGDTSPAFVERIARLLSPEAALPEGRPPAAAVPAAAAAPRPPAAGPASSLRAPWVLMIAAVAIVGLGYLAADKFVLPKREAGTKQASAQPAPAVTRIPDKSIAVLPFVDMSEKHDQEYFSDGLSEELLDLLAKTQGLEVIARTSSFYFKGKQATIAEIANTLHVAHLLEGSVRKAGRTMRVTAQLIRAQDGVHLWSDTYDRDFKDVFKVQDEIAAAVVKALQVKLLQSPVKAEAESDPHNTDAYSLYLQGQYFARRASNVDVDRGIASLRQAIALAPDFAPAHAELASAYLYVATFGTGAPMSLERARAEVDEALRLDPTLRLAHNTRSNVAIINWDWASAKAQIDEALASAPSDPEALFRRGLLARALGHPDEALIDYRKGLELDPLRVIYHVQLAMLLDCLRRPDEARAAAETAIAISPTVTKAHLLLGLFELKAGHLDAASAAMEREPAEYYRLEGQAIVAFANKHLAESDAALARLIGAYHDTSSVQIAEAYAYRGEHDRAFDWLDRAFTQHDAGLINLKTNPLFAGLRADARYKALLHKINLPE